MKNLLKAAMLLSIVAIFSSCDDDEGLLPNISFKTGVLYTSKDTTLPGGSPILIGIDASKSESEDVLKKFNVSTSVNGATATAVYDKDLSGSEGNNYSYDFATILENVSGQTNKYIFTVTNRDGLVNQVSLTVTIQ